MATEDGTSFKTEDGITFETWSHRDRWRVLKKRLAAGEISELKYRQRWALHSTNEETKVKTQVEHFKAQFFYKEQGIKVAETIHDFQHGRLSDRYILLRTMVIAQWGIEVREVMTRR